MGSEHGWRFVAIGCKLSSNPSDQDLRGIRALEAYYGAGSVERSYVVCRAPHEFAFASRPDTRAVSVDRLTAAL